MGTWVFKKKKNKVAWINFRVPMHKQARIYRIMGPRANIKNGHHQTYNWVYLLKYF